MKKQEITIQISRGKNKFTFEKIQAFVDGFLAAHKTYNGKAQYVITHIPSGLTIKKDITLLQIAKAAVVKLNSLHNWSFDDLQKVEEKELARMGFNTKNIKTIMSGLTNPQ
jgi:hypothetical protein